MTREVVCTASQTGAEAGGGPGEDFEGALERATVEGFELFGGGEDAPGSL
jgi:hypothetical protein